MNPREHAIAFEAKKHAYRQTQDGVVISFVMHPDEVDAALSAAALGTRYQVALVQLGDDGEPTGGPKSTPRRWETLKASEQAGIRCNDPVFQAWVSGQSELAPADFVRRTCGVRSRSELDEGKPLAAWRELDARYQDEITPKVSP